LRKPAYPRENWWSFPMCELAKQYFDRKAGALDIRRIENWNAGKLYSRPFRELGKGRDPQNIGKNCSAR
jgi:hypothetical protein